MDAETIAELISSRSRLRIVDLLSRRPRTLKELSVSTGISVQGVLKHMNKLDEMGLVREKKFKGSEIPIRRTYYLKGSRIRDFSLGDLTIIKSTSAKAEGLGSKHLYFDLERLAEDGIVLRRRVRDRTRRLGRVIDELVDAETKLVAFIESMDLDEEDRLVLLTAFTEETLQDAERVLREVHGVPEPRRSIARALAKARRNVKK